MHLFVYFARIHFCPFSLPLGTREWLRLVILALTGLSINVLAVNPALDGVRDIASAIILSLMNKLNKIESAVFKIWMLYNFDLYLDNTGKHKNIHL